MLFQRNQRCTKYELKKYILLVIFCLFIHLLYLPIYPVQGCLGIESIQAQIQAYSQCGQTASLSQAKTCRLTTIHTPIHTYRQ